MSCPFSADGVSEDAAQAEQTGDYVSSNWSDEERMNARVLQEGNRIVDAHKLTMGVSVGLPREELGPSLRRVEGCDPAKHEHVERDGSEQKRRRSSISWYNASVRSLLDLFQPIPAVRGAAFHPHHLLDPSCAIRTARNENQ